MLIAQQLGLMARRSPYSSNEHSGPRTTSAHLSKRPVVLVIPHTGWQASTRDPMRVICARSLQSVSCNRSRCSSARRFGGVGPASACPTNAARRPGLAGLGCRTDQGERDMHVGQHCVRLLDVEIG
jgi:hypothetical protein